MAGHYLISSEKSILETLRKYFVILTSVYHTIHIKSGILKINDLKLKVTYNAK